MSASETRVLIAGARGQLGGELIRSVPKFAQVTAPGKTDLDITDKDAVAEAVSRLAPDVIINAAAYTQVDQAESEPERAWKINCDGARNLALAASEFGARYLLVSTDFVFDGSQGRAYLPEDEPAPCGVYGASKLAGEQAALEVHPTHTLVMRTSWLYAAHGANFVNSMLRLMREKPELGVVADQISSPTWAAGLAEALWAAVEYPAMQGIAHYSDAGVASWYDFAVEIQDQALATGLLESRIPIHPITTAEFPRPAQRPTFSALDCRETRKQLELSAHHWRHALASMLAELAPPSRNQRESVYA